MKNSNIIISVIIVLCIAGGVTAYGFLNPDGNIMNLPGFSSSDDTNDLSSQSDDGIGANNSTNASNTGASNSNSGNTGSGDSSKKTTSGNSASNSAKKSASTSGNSGSGNSGGSSTGGGGSSDSASKISASQAKSIAAGAIQEEGCHAGTPSKSGNSWIVPIIDSNGTQVDGIEVDAKTGAILGRA